VLRRSGVPFEKSGLRRVTLSRLMPCVLLVVPVRRQDELGQDHRRDRMLAFLPTQSFPDEMTPPGNAYGVTTHERLKYIIHG